MADPKRSSKSKKSPRPNFPGPNLLARQYESQWNLEYRREFLNQWAQRESQSMSPPDAALGPRNSNMCNAPDPSNPSVLCRATRDHPLPCYGASVNKDGQTVIHMWSDGQRGVAMPVEEQEPRQPDLPKEQRSIPIIAWKSAACRVDKAGKSIGLWSGPLTGKQHQIEAVAECVYRNHKAPAIACGGSSTAGCGFYSVMDEEAIVPRGAVVRLEVELSGTVIAHQSGYRAEKQRILSVTFGPGMCEGFLCRKVPTQVHFPFGEGNDPRPVCDQHAPDNGRVAPLALISEHLGIPAKFVPYEE